MAPTPLPSSSSKHPASPPAASPPEKRAKILLPDSQLLAVNAKMDKGLVPYTLKMARDDPPWSGLLPTALAELTQALASTNLKGSTRMLDSERADDLVTNLSKVELEQLKVDVQNCVEKNDWTDLIMNSKLQRLPGDDTLELFVPQQIATGDSWTRNYNGQAAEALWTHIQSHYDPNSGGDIYAHFCSVVQSSGMGKSRTVDELGKQHFSIPINLRDARSTGYPPADHEVRNFLTRNGTESESYHRACCFIDALFQYTCHILETTFDLMWTIVNLTSEFRRCMTEGQTMKEHNEYRRKFYQQVVQMAEDKLRAQPESKTRPGYISPPRSKDPIDHGDFAPSAACHKLVQFLEKRKQEKKKKSKKKSSGNPLIILAVDEAHTLTQREETSSSTWSNFSTMRHVLRALHSFPLFALFLSTTGKISQFISPNDDTSKRIISGALVVIQPFTDLGFDTLAQKVSLNGSFNLELVTADDHIVHLGRPLFGSRYDAGDFTVREDIVMFAVAKLLNADPNAQEFSQDQMLACLSQRLPIQFNSTSYLSQPAERKQVEGHMRVCLKINATYESMETVSASEPLLSEAAYVIMARASFDPLKCFKSVLEGFAVHKGDRGEFLALLLLTLARDEAVGRPDRYGRPARQFFNLASFVYSKLFRTNPSSQLNKLREDFPNATMHFNHFIKLHDFKSINKKSLLLLMTRGAGVLCANNQRSIDAVNVFLRTGTTLSINNLGLIVYQVKNDSRYSHIPQTTLFESMDPYNLGILEAGDAPVPIIKIFFALAAKSPSLHVVRHDPSDTYNAVVYDIWSAGLSSDYLQPINPESDIWDDLLQASYAWKDIYKTADLPKEL